MYVGISLIRIYQREDDLIGHLVQDACNAKDQDGPRILKHPAQQTAVEVPMNLEQVRDKEKRYQSRTQQIDEEHVEDRGLA